MKKPPVGGAIINLRLFSVIYFKTADHHFSKLNGSKKMTFFTKFVFPSENKTALTHKAVLFNLQA